MAGPADVGGPGANLGSWIDFASGGGANSFAEPLTPEQQAAADAAKAAADAQKAEDLRLHKQRYVLNPDDPNYIANTAADVRSAGLQTYGQISGVADTSADVGSDANRDLQNLGADAMQNIGTYGTREGGRLQDLGQQAAGQIGDVADAGSQQILNATTGGKKDLYTSALTGATNIADAATAGQDALVNFSNQQTGALGAAGAGALGQLGAYGQTQGATLGALGAGAAQTAAAQGQLATQNAIQQGGQLAASAAQQGAQLSAMAAQAGGGVTQGALAQSDAINAFAAQQQAAAAAARARSMASPNFDAANALYGQAGATANALGGLEAVEGPSAAQAQLQSGLNAAQASNLAMARSGRGFGGSASALSQAAAQNAAAGQEAANRAAALRATENAQWRARQAANLGQVAGIQSSLGAQQQGQSEFTGELGLRQQALIDQTALGYGSQALGALTDAGTLAMQGGLGGGQLALQGGVQGGQLAQQGGQFGADLALRGTLGGGDLGMQGAQLQGQLAGQGAELGMRGLQSGQELNLQALQAASQTGLQGLQSGYGMGMEGAQSAADMRFAAAQQGAQLGLQGAGMATDTSMQGVLQGAQLAADTYGQGAQLGLGAIQDAYGMGMQGVQSGAELGLQGAGQAGALYGAGQDAYMAGIGMENQLYQQEQAAARAEYQDELTRYGIAKGVAVQQSAQDQQALGGYVSAGAALLPLLAMASDRDAKQDIKPATTIEIPPLNPNADNEHMAPSGGRGGMGGMGDYGPDPVAYSSAMGSANRAEKERIAKEIRFDDAVQNAIGGIGRAGAQMQRGTGMDPYFLNPIGRQYLASDVNSKTEIEQLRGQVQALGGTPAPSPMVAAQTSAPQASSWMGSPSPMSRAPGAGLQTAAGQAQSPAFANQTAALAPMSRQPTGTAPPALSQQTAGAVAQPAMQRSAPGLGTAATKAPTQAGSFGVDATGKRTMPTGLVASDERSKTRIAELEGQVSAYRDQLGFKPAAMELGYDASVGPAGLYRELGSRIGGSTDFADPMGVERMARLGLDPTGSPLAGDALYSSLPSDADVRQRVVQGGERFLGAPDVFDPYGQFDVAAHDEAYTRQTGLRPAVNGAPGVFRSLTQAEMSQQAPTRASGYMPMSTEQQARAAEIGRVIRGARQDQLMGPSALGESARDMLEEAPGYTFRYKEPERFGEGLHAGLMAQDLQRSPLGKSMVKKGPDGTLLVDSGKVAMATAAAVSNMQRDIENLKRGEGATKEDIDIDIDAYDAEQARGAAYQDAVLRPGMTSEYSDGVMRGPPPDLAAAERDWIEAERNMGPGGFNPFHVMPPNYDQEALDAAYLRSRVAPSYGYPGAF